MTNSPAPSIANYGCAVGICLAALSVLNLAVTYGFWRLTTIPRRLCRGVGNITYASVMTIGGAIARAGRFGNSHAFGIGGLAIYLLVATVSHLITVGMVQMIPLELQENAIASGLLGIANRVSGSVHREALDKVNLHCKTAFGISGYGQTWLSFDEAEAMAKARGIPFAGLSERQGHRPAGTQLASTSAATTLMLSRHRACVQPYAQRRLEGLTELCARPTA